MIPAWALWVGFASALCRPALAQTGEPPIVPVPVTAATTSPANTSPLSAPVIGTSATTNPSATTQPEVDLRALHRQAVALMRAGKWRQAMGPMNRLLRARPIGQQPRAVVLNEAILDVKLQASAPRAVRNLTLYLREHHQPDELATNVLGSALDEIADRPGMRKNPLFLEGVTEWQRRNDDLEGTRPGSHRWGVEWLTPKRYEHLRTLRMEHQSRVDQQQYVVNRAAALFNARYATYQNLIAQSNQEPPMLLDRSGTPVQARSHMRGTYDTATGTNIDGWIAQGQAQRMIPDLNAAKAELELEQKKLATLKAQFPRPYWPHEYPPLDPD
jgi:hypothetical protein